MTAILDRATFALGPNTNQCPNPKNEKSLKEYEKRGGLGRGGRGGAGGRGKIK